MNVCWLLGAVREKISTKLSSVDWKIFKLPLTYQPPKQQVDLKFGQFQLGELILIVLYTKLLKIILPLNDKFNKLYILYIYPINH